MNWRNARHSFVALACIVFLVFAACRRFSQPNNMAQSTSGTHPLFTPNSASLADQKMCDEQANKRFRETTQNETSLSSYTSRYDPAVNVCYVRLYYMTGRPATVIDTVSDAFGGRVFASYAWIDDPKLGPRITMCKVSIPGKSDQTCAAAEEFKQLVERYFGVAQ